MISTFFGLEAARSGLTAAQSALYTIGHNVANAETPGYTRQRVNLAQKQAYPTPGRFQPDIPGQFGTGVETETVQRIRDRFLDVQYRGENAKLGYWTSRSDALKKMEDVMNELTGTGLNETLNQFWQSLQDLATNSAARSVVRQRGVAVADTFNYLAQTLQHNQQDLKNELNVTTTKINSLLEQINNINKQIGEVEPNGYLPNDLYDERDRLLDELSSYVDIKVTPVKSGGNSLEIAEGKVTVELAGVNPPITLVDGNRLKTNEFYIDYSGTNDLVQSVSIGARTVDFGSFQSTGSLKSLIESYGYTNGASSVEYGLYPEMMDALDVMAYEFANAFNEVHRNGWSIEDINNGTQAQLDFFDLGGLTTYKGAAATIRVADEIMETPDRIAYSGTGEMGDGSNALALAEVKNKPMLIGDQYTTIQTYYENLIGEMAVLAQEADRMADNSATLASSVEDRRKSVSSVSLDEELTNMIQFQHMYNAAARMITLQDEILDRIINGMGLVGR